MKITAYKVNDTIQFNCPFELKNVVKELGADWNGRRKKWSMPFSITAIRDCQLSGIELSEELKQAEALQVARETSQSDLETPKIASERPKKGAETLYKTTPYSHQKALTKLTLERNKCLYLCDVGTGKSKASIDSLLELGIERALVITPACVMANFKKEVETHSDYKVAILEGSLAKRKDLLSKSEHQIYIVNYEMLPRLKKDLITFRFKAVIFDEVHYLKNPQSNRSRSAFHIVQDIPVRI